MRKISEAPVGISGAANFPKCYEGVAHGRKGQSLVVRHGAKRFCSSHFNPGDTPRITLSQMVWTLCNLVSMTLRINHHRCVLQPLSAKDLVGSIERVPRPRPTWIKCGA